MRLNISKIIGSIVALAIVGAIVFTLIKNKKIVDTRSEGKVTDTEIAVTVVQAETKEVDNQLKFVGTVNPDKEVIVSAETVGKIVSINFKLGDYVTKGAVLACIDETNALLSYENAQISYNKSKDDYERYQILREGDAVSEIQLRDTKITYDNANIQLKNAKKALSDTKIISPFSGYITSRNTELGAYVNPGTPIAALADIFNLKVTLSVPETSAYLLSKGQSVTITANVLPDVIFNGNISNVSPQGSSSHTYPVEIAISNSKNQLKAGTYVNIDITLGENIKALLVPRDAIVSSVKDPSVYLIKDNIAKLVKINIGRDLGPYMEILSGIEEGDYVVTNGQINLSDGAKVLTNKK